MTLDSPDPSLRGMPSLSSLTDTSSAPSEVRLDPHRPAPAGTDVAQKVTTPPQSPSSVLDLHQDVSNV